MNYNDSLAADFAAFMAQTSGPMQGALDGLARASKGGRGSGNWGHAGRPGQIGGSAAGGGGKPAGTSDAGITVTLVKQATGLYGAKIEDVLEDLPEARNGATQRLNYAKITDVIVPGGEHSKLATQALVASAKRQAAAAGQEFGSNELHNLAVVVRKDSTIRRTGKAMKSKFPGKDDITGRRFEAGADIIYSSYGTVIA